MIIAYANSHNRVKGWFALPVLLAALAIAVPYFSTHGFLVIAFVLRRGLALVCHQRAERSFWIFGAPVAVCARCVGIYIGATIGLLLRTSRRISLQILIVVAALNLFDASAELVGLHGNWITLRFVLGLTLGASGALLISSSMPPTSARTAAIS